ncbi:MAG: FAD:protein FMN transferase [Spirochaetes bacterium]|nr:FAD:protein FMN transferase [Spirochaetota bacterium]
MLGTTINITLITDSEEQANKTFDDVFREINRIENLLSYYMKDSEITKINKNSGNPTVVSDETFYLINKCNELSELSDGAFDISFSAVGKLWKFGGNFMPPSDALIKTKLKFVNYKNILLDSQNKTVTLKLKGMAIGLGSIGKRYAIGRAAKKIKFRNIDDAIVQTGGDMQVFGTKFGKNWTIGVENPRGEGLLYSFEARSGETISSSGDYKRCQIYKGKRYHHIFDPRTGYPTNTFASVTVITEIPDNADGLSTAIFVMGKDKYRKLLKHFAKTYLILIDQEMKIYISKELKDRIKPLVKEAEVINWI